MLTFSTPVHTLFTPRRHARTRALGSRLDQHDESYIDEKYACTTRSSLLADRFHTKRGGVSRLHDAVAKFLTGVIVLAPIQEGANGGTHFSVNYYFFGQFSVNY